MKEKTIKEFLELANAYQETAEPKIPDSFGEKYYWEKGFWEGIKFAEDYWKGKKE